MDIKSQPAQSMYRKYSYLVYGK